MRPISCSNCGERFDLTSSELCPRPTCGYPVTVITPADDEQVGGEASVLRAPKEPVDKTDQLPPLPPVPTPERVPTPADARRPASTHPHPASVEGI